MYSLPAPATELSSIYFLAPGPAPELLRIQTLFPASAAEMSIFYEVWLLHQLH